MRTVTVTAKWISSTRPEIDVNGTLMDFSKPWETLWIGFNFRTPLKDWLLPPPKNAPLNDLGFFKRSNYFILKRPAGNGYKEIAKDATPWPSAQQKSDAAKLAVYEDMSLEAGTMYSEAGQCIILANGGGVGDKLLPLGVQPTPLFVFGDVCTIELTKSGQDISVKLNTAPYGLAKGTAGCTCYNDSGQSLSEPNTDGTTPASHIGWLTPCEFDDELGTIALYTEDAVVQVMSVDYQPA